MAQLASAPAHRQRLVPPAVLELPWHPGLCTLWSPPGRCRAGQEQRRCLVSKGSGAALEGKVLHSQQRAQQTCLQEQRCPFPMPSSSPASHPASLPTSHCGWGTTKERPGPGERIPAPKNQSPRSSSAGSGGQTKRGREGSHPKYYSRERREVRLRDASHAASSPRRARPGCQAGKCRTERKKNKQNKTKKIIKTQQKQTEPQRNATQQPQAGGPSMEEGGGAGSPMRSTAFGSFLPPHYLAILIPLWKFSQDISFSSRSPPREPWTGNFF